MVQLNTDFSQRVVINTTEIPWQDSPMQGVQRRMLDRDGNESGRATSIVRYAPGSHFPAHQHPGGEEFLVLDGIFQDEHADYPAGCYVRNPPESSHTPGSAMGCTIFVKLWQFDPADRTQVCVQTQLGTPAGQITDVTPGTLPLYEDAAENVRIECWSAGSSAVLRPEGGLEILVLSGEFRAFGQQCGELTWLRLPDGEQLSISVSESGAAVWIKEGHLRLKT